MVQDKGIRVQLRDERAVIRLTLASVEARLACEALGEASSCRSADHGPNHRKEQQRGHKQNELGTDLEHRLWD